MLLFVGKKEKGFFTEETGEKVEYIDEALHIKDQAEAILRFNEEATVVIYDIEQYADEAKELVHWINRIEDVTSLNAARLVEIYKKDQLKDGKLKEIASRLNEEDNPVIMLVKQKK